MKTNRILYESHMHTPLCKHAIGYPEDYAEVAWQRGLKGIIVTCHNPSDVGMSPWVRMGVDQFDDYIEIVERARKEWHGKIDVRLGMETDYLPGIEASLEKLHNRADFNHILGSVHPQLEDYRNRYFHGDYVAFQRGYFEHLAMAAETGLFDTISHPDIVKIIEPGEWKLDRVLGAACDCLDRIAATGTAMELNTSGVLKRVPEMNPGLTLLKEMKKRDIPVVVGADAHEPDRVSDGYEDAFDLLCQAGYTHINIVLNRHRQEIAIEEARASLNKLSDAPRNFVNLFQKGRKNLNPSLHLSKTQDTWA